MHPCPEVCTHERKKNCPTFLWCLDWLPIDGREQITAGSWCREEGVGQGSFENRRSPSAALSSMAPENSEWQECWRIFSAVTLEGAPRLPPCSSGGRPLSGPTIAHNVAGSPPNRWMLDQIS